LASSDISSIKIHYEYQVDGVTRQSSGSQNRIITSNAGESFGQQNDLTTSDIPRELVMRGVGRSYAGISP